MLVFLYCHQGKDTRRHRVYTAAVVADPMGTTWPPAFGRLLGQKGVERTSLFEESLGIHGTDRTLSLVKDPECLGRKDWLDLVGCRQAKRSGVVEELWLWEGCNRRPRKYHSTYAHPQHRE